MATVSARSSIPVSKFFSMFSDRMPVLVEKAKKLGRSVSFVKELSRYVCIYLLDQCYYNANSSCDEE